MGRDRNPTIRILLLGAAGVGKNCLESRFTTTTYPPPYDPAFTLNSRRFFTLSPRPPTPSGPTTRRLETSHGLPPLEIDTEAVRPFTATSTYSNPASQQPPTEPNGEAPAAGTTTVTTAPAAPRLNTAATNPSSPTDTEPRSPARGNYPPPLSAGVCLDCVRDTNTYMVEVINYPGLQLSRERHALLAKGEYDAVMIVYDVASRESFELASVLHGEIQAAAGRHLHHYQHKQQQRAGRSSWKPHFGKEGGPVVALVGNKTDFDEEFRSVEAALEGYFHDKQAKIQALEVEERHMVHPLYREVGRDVVYDEMPMSARSLGRFASTRDLLADGRRSVVSVDRYTSRNPGKLVKSKSVQTIRLGGEAPGLRYLHRRASKRELVNSWLETGSPTREHHQEVDETDGSTQVDTQDSESTTAVKRQVSRVEGEAMAQRLGIRVPFLETSAKTGENVEELFENVIRQALGAMGKDVAAPDSPTSPAEPARPCRKRGHGNGANNNERDSKFSSAANSPVDSVPEGRGGGFGGAQSGRMQAGDEDGWPAPPIPANGDDERPTPPAPRKKERRESVLKRMSSLFFKKKQPSMVDVSA